MISKNDTDPDYTKKCQFCSPNCCLSRDFNPNHPLRKRLCVSKIAEESSKTSIWVTLIKTQQSWSWKLWIISTQKMYFSTFLTIKKWRNSFKSGLMPALVVTTSQKRQKRKRQLSKRSHSMKKRKRAKTTICPLISNQSLLSRNEKTVNNEINLSGIDFGKNESHSNPREHFYRA